MIKLPATNSKTMNNFLSRAKNRLLRACCNSTSAASRKTLVTTSQASSKQYLDCYWDEDFAKMLETWGEKNAWHELDYLMASRSGKVLDIACGTGKNMAHLRKFKNLDLYGCDISDFLIDKGIARGIGADRLTVCNATELPFADDEFEYSYSIGSLEHFDMASLDLAIKESQRITKVASFHQVPTSRNQLDNGWIERSQSYWKNSVDFWANRFKMHCDEVDYLPSLWEDMESVGHWFICSNRVRSRPIGIAGAFRRAELVTAPARANMRQPGTTISSVPWSGVTQEEQPRRSRG
jgi:ubiquinone/menaquinone biosynthesis C-methylase UbiE